MSLYEVCAALDDETLSPRCLLGNVACSQDRSCPAHTYYVSSRARLTRFLERTTIADIAQFEARKHRRRPGAAAWPIPGETASAATLNPYQRRPFRKPRNR